MAIVLRTTGGLLQLKNKQVSRSDYSGIVEFARTLRDDGVRTRLEKQSLTQSTQTAQQQRAGPKSLAEKKPDPVDLQAVIPEVFR